MVEYYKYDSLLGRRLRNVRDSTRDKAALSLFPSLFLAFRPKSIFPELVFQLFAFARIRAIELRNLRTLRDWRWFDGRTWKWIIPRFWNTFPASERDPLILFLFSPPISYPQNRFSRRRITKLHEFMSQDLSRFWMAWILPIIGLFSTSSIGLPRSRRCSSYTEGKKVTSLKFLLDTMKLRV